MRCQFYSGFLSAKATLAWMKLLASCAVLLACLLTVACAGGATGSPAPPTATDEGTPPAARDTYLTLGDSVAAGIGASAASETYAAKLYAQLRAAEPAFTRHLNFAVPGATSESLLGEQMEQAIGVLESGRVRLVTLAIGANDLLALLSTCQEDLLSETCIDNAGREVESVRDNLAEAVDVILEADPGVQVVLLDYYNPLAPVFPDTAGYVANLNAVLHERASEDGLPLVEVFPAFDGHERELTHIEAQDVHPNDDGHQLIADLAAGVILGNQ
jgi:lysophospholipase L1-like esterase